MPTRLLLFFFLFAFGFTSAQRARPVQLSTPSWVNLHQIPYHQNQLDHQADDGFIDLCYEQQISLSQQSSYYRKAVRILTESGVQNFSKVSLDYDPSYQQLQLHSLQILRHGQVMNKLKMHEVKVLQQEKELDASIYNGRLSAVFLLSDVRKGDVIEYSYTLKGFNPVAENKFSETFYLQFSVPVYHIYYRVIVPQSRNLYFKSFENDLQPMVSKTGDETVYEWRKANTGAVHFSNDMPGWYDGYACVSVSEYKDWKEIVDWGVRLYPKADKLSAALQEKIREFNQSATVEEKIGKALRFVQDEIRYMGMEVGVNSHRPHAPAQILDQRFGDCKDKVYLLHTLLHSMNIESYPVLINTVLKQQVKELLPSPYAFDHVTILVKANGKQYWFDPTISYQRGTIDRISFPDYGAGLVLSPASLGMTAIRQNKFGRVDVKEEFDVLDMSTSARFVVRTVYTGTFADDARYEFNTSNKQDIQTTYTNFYRSYFKEIEADSVGFIDQPDGSFVTTEFYTIPSFWKTENGNKKVLLESYLINSLIKRPKEKKRKIPFGLKYPASYREEITIRFPEAWSIEAHEERVAHASFRFSSKSKLVDDRTAVLQYEYESLKDHLLPHEVSSYTEAIEKMDALTAFEFYSNGKTSSNSTYVADKGVFNYTILYVLLGVCVAVTYLVKRNKLI